MQELKLEIPEAEEKVLEYAVSAYPKMSLNYLRSLSSAYVKTAHNYKLSSIQNVSVTAAEVSSVSKLDTIKKQCLAFSLLAVAKYDTLLSSKVNYWVNGNRLNEIAQRANLAIPERELCLILHEMYQLDMIKLAKRVDSCSVQVLYRDNNSKDEITLHDSDFRDLGYAWRAYLGEPYIRCEECDGWIRQSGNGSRRYCKDCAAESRRRTYRESKRRRT